MFLKKQSVHKQGQLYTYYRIVESYRDEQGKNKHRTIQYIGRLSDEEVVTITRQLKEHSYPFLEGSRSSKLENKQQTRLLSSKVWVPLSLTIVTYLPAHLKEWIVAEHDTLMIVKEGQAEAQIQGSRLLIHANQVLFCPAGSGVFLYNASAQPLQVFKVMFTSNDSTLTSSRSAMNLPAIISTHSPLEIQRLCKEWLEITEYATELSMEKQIYSQLLFYQLLHLIWNDQSVATEASHLTLIEQAVHYVKTHYREEIRRDVIAAQLGITPEHFSRIFRKYKDCSFTEYVYRWRMNMAKKDLQSSSASISEIAKRNAYPDDHYFSRRFKQSFSLSPKQYQSSKKQYAAWNYPFTAMLLHLDIVPQAGYLESWKWDIYHRKLDLSTMNILHTDLDQSIQLMNKLQPDLVFAYQDNAGKEMLEEYVPLQTIEIDDYDWKQQWLWLAEQVGEVRQAEQWLHNWNTQVEQARKQLLQQIPSHQTVGIYKIVSEKIYVYGDQRSMGGPLIYQELGHQPPVIVQERIIDQHFICQQIEISELNLYAADHMIVIHYPVEGETATLIEPVMESEAWSQLQAVQNKQVYMMDRNIFYGFDPCSLEAQLHLWLQQFRS